MNEDKQLLLRILDELHSQIGALSVDEEGRGPVMARDDLKALRKLWFPPTPIAVLVCGGRKFRDKALLEQTLTSLRRRTEELHPWAIMIVGRATGADALAEAWAISQGLTIMPFPAQWDDITHPDAVIRYHKSGKPYDARAGSRRNTRMLEQGKPGLVIAFPGGDGTSDMVRQARAAGVHVIEIRP